MSRGPLEVLRDMRADAACRVHRDVCDECKAYDEAIAQVEALVIAARAAAPVFAELGWPNTSAMLLEAVAPFTPGQDSEGGGNG